MSPAAEPEPEPERPEPGAAQQVAQPVAQDVAQDGAQDVAQRAADAMWAGDAASRALGMDVLAVAPGRARVRMTVRADMVNGHGIGHGGLTFALADTAFAVACNSYNRSTVAAECRIRFLAPTRLGDVLLASAVERSRVGRDGVYDVEVSRGQTVVAQFEGLSKEIRGVLFSDEER